MYFKNYNPCSLKQKTHPLWIIGAFVLFCLGLGYAIIRVPSLPVSILIFPIAGIVWLVFVYPIKWAYIATIGYLVIRFWVNLAGINPQSPILLTAITGIILIILIFWLGRLIERHRQADKKLEEARELYRVVADCSEDLEIWIDPEKKFIFISPSSECITGYAPQEFYNNQELFFSIIHPEDRPKILAILETREKTSRLTEFRIQRKDGKECWIENACSTVFDEQGKYLGYRGSMRDISDRKATERELELTYRRLKIVLEHLNEGLFDWDLECEQIYFSTEIAQVLEITGNETILPVSILDSAKGFREILPMLQDNDLERFRIALLALINNDAKLVEIEIQFLRKSGKKYWILCRAISMRSEENDKPIRIIGSFIDITTLKEAEENLKRSEKKFRDLIEQQGEGVVIADAKEQIVYANPAADILYGEKIGGLLGRYITEYLAPDQVSIILAQTLRREKGEVGSYELQITGADGEKRQILITATPRYNAEGKFIESIGVLRDITKRTEAENHLRYLSHHDVLTGVHNRTYYEDAVDRLEKKDEFPISVIMIDLDGLKNTNDQLGHHTGDEMLKP